MTDETTGLQHESPSIGDLVEAHIDEFERNLWTISVGVVEEYDRLTQRADIQLVTPDEDGDTVPVLVGVKVAWLQGGGGSIHSGLSEGDGVLVLFAVRSLDGWIRDGVSGRVPQAAGRHDVNNAIAIPGISPDSSALSSNQARDGALVVDGDDIRLGAGATDNVALATPIADYTADLLTFLGAVKAAITGAGIPLPDVPPSAIDPSASKVKAE